MNPKVRVRFAPSPTGDIHLGNVRTALLNYLFARQHEGVLVLRIEDTDAQRNVELGGVKIVEDLNWLGLSYDEGPNIGGDYAPYLQSMRNEIYKEKLDQLILNQKVYRCFCSADELERKRKEQLAKGEPPRYDRTCLNLSDDMIKAKLAAGEKFIWRLKINHDAVAEVNTLARGKMVFELKNFSDFALTRPDGSYTFMFTNFVDDWLMHITFVIRGEDHLTNTAMQAALYDAFSVSLPYFWHLPMLCNEEGKKMSKRDFGFSLSDLKRDGFLPQAICNYLATVGYSFEQEVQSLDELVKNFDFKNLHATGAIRFDVEKLKWFNHQWIQKLGSKELLGHVRPLLEGCFKEVKSLDDSKLCYLIDKVSTDVRVLNDFCDALKFYFQEPEFNKSDFVEKFGEDKVKNIFDVVAEVIKSQNDSETFLDYVKEKGKEAGLKPREVFGSIRYALTGNFQGQSMHDLFDMLDFEVVKKRLGRIS